MAHKILQGQSWIAANFSTGTLPDDGDNAWISVALKGDVNDGLDQGGVDVDLIAIPRGFSHNVASHESPLRIACDALEHYGSGGLYYLADANAGGALDTDFVRIQCETPRAITELTSGTGTDAGDYHRIVLERGNVRFLADMAFDAAALVLVGYMTNLLGDVHLTIGAGADTLPTLHQSGGVIESDRAITNAYCSAGSLIQSTAAITTLFIGAGATCTYNHTALTTVVVHGGGTLNLLGNSYAKTITTAYFMPGSIVNYHADLVTITNSYDYRRPGP